MGFTKIIHKGFLAPCGSQEGLPSPLNGQWSILAAGDENGSLFSMCSFHCLPEEKLPHHLYSV